MTLQTEFGACVRNFSWHLRVSILGGIFLWSFPRLFRLFSDIISVQYLTFSQTFSIKMSWTKKIILIALNCSVLPSRTNLLSSCWLLTHIHPCKLDLNRNDIKCGFHDCENTREGFREDQSAWEFGKRFNICLQISCRV